MTDDSPQTEILAARLAGTQWRTPAPAIEALTTTGLAHDHFRLGGSGLLARVPKQSQMALDPGTVDMVPRWNVVLQGSSADHVAER